MRRNNLSLRRKSSVAQKDPEKLIAKLVSYVIQTRRMQKAHNFQASHIIAMKPPFGVTWFRKQRLIGVARKRSP